jgi:4-alpha-glucanotransferase
MKIAHFAFNLVEPGKLDPSNAYLPHNYPELCVAYTGTHDNDTTKGWFEKLGDAEKDIVRRYLSCSDDGVVWHLMRSIMASIAQYAIVPMQDVLGLGGEARMNLPGTCGAPNWCWRLVDNELGDAVRSTLTALVQPFGRTATHRDLPLALSLGN